MPPWVEWVAVFLTIAAIAIPIAMFLWRRWVADWWAARSREAAEKRAMQLWQDVVTVHRLSRNRPAMFSGGVRCFLWMILGCTSFLTAGLIWFNRFAPSLDHAPPSEGRVVTREAAVALLFAMAYLFAFRGLTIWRRWLRPLSDLDGYTRWSRARIEALYARAGITSKDAAPALGALDTKIEEIRESPIK